MNYLKRIEKSAAAKKKINKYSSLKMHDEAIIT